MNRILALVLGSTAALYAMATEGSPSGMSDEVAFFVHSQDNEGVIVLNANGRILTDLNERPEWAHGLAVAMLHERTKYYTDRLGSEGAADHLSQNTVYVEDLSWVGFDEAGDEVEVAPLSEFRASVLATALGVDGEGEVHGAIAERVIAGDTASWSEEAAFQDPNAMPQTATGTKG